MGKYLHQITELSETPANGDLILVQDISDTTDSKNGTTKRVTYSNLTSGLGGGSGLSNIVEDTTPQLGGSLDVNGKSIVSTSGANITIAPNGVGNVILGTMSFDADQSIGAGQDNYVLTYDNSTGLISLEVAAGGGSGDITAVNITTDSGAGSKASDTSGDADFSLLGGDGISVTNSGATITVALADPDSDDGSDIDEGVIATNDRLLIWDETANNWKYVTVDNLQDEIDTNTGISNVVEDTSPQLGGQLDVNGQAIGDGTRELLTFTEDGSAVNHINIENQATGGGPIISTAGDDSDVDLILSPKGTGNVTIAARTVINGTAPLGTLTVYGDNASDQAFVLKAAAGQAATIWQVLESTGHLVFSVATNYINTKSLLPLTTNTWDVGQWNLSYDKVFGKVLYTDPGTASVPSYNFHAGSDTLHNTGLFGTATKLGMSVGGVEKASATTSGLVAGLGASLGTLTVHGQDSDDETLVVRGASGQSADILQVQNNGGTELFTIDDEGKVGINAAAPNAKLSVNGSMSLPIEAISATDTLDDTNHTVLVNAAGGVKTVNLPAASGATGKTFIIKKTDSSSNNVTIDPNASETIDGSSTFVFNAQYRAVTLQCDGSNWHIISSYIVNY